MYAVFFEILALGSGVICRKIRGGGVEVSQVKPSNCFRRLKNLVFLPSIFDRSLSYS